MYGACDTFGESLMSIKCDMRILSAPNANIILVDFFIRIKYGLITESKMSVPITYQHRIACDFACHLPLRLERFSV